ncbi:MAG: ImmA/IrrE family metallo-endopeptidase [Peptoanaerobacter stomatis]|uniref:ImmA/IrrE family metallo-endopeptidase n=1 Tax=Peptoanaerobacter stomatis TaxID=796937 RepID=UPI003FA0F3DA
MAFAFKDIDLYKSIKEFQESQGLIEYPINLFKLCYKNNWYISEYSTKYKPNLPKDGFSLSKNGEFFIFYNTYMNCGGRIRFTIAHEIGHLILNHHFIDDYFENKDEIEKQADYFAGNLLVPAILLKHNKKFVDRIKLIQDYFNVSEECAINRVQYYNFWNNRIRYSDTFKNRLLSTFNDSLIEFENEIIKNKLSFSY